MEAWGLQGLGDHIINFVRTLALPKEAEQWLLTTASGVNAFQ
jgi:hypothetical protein